MTVRETDERGYDIEVVALVDALNALPGIRTIESCCGHGESGFRIWLRAQAVADLLPINYWIDPCHSGVHGWNLTVSTDCSHDPDSVYFLLSGPAGAFDDATEIAALIREHEVAA